MKSKSFLALPTFIIFLIILGIACSGVNSKESQPDQIVINFIKKLKDGDSNGASGLLTNSPEYLDKVFTLKLDRINKNYIEPELLPQNGNSLEENNSNQSVPVTKKRESLDNQKLLRIVTESFQKELDFEKIVSVINYENESKVVASFLREGYANSDYNFLLIKEGSEWKIFMIYPNNGIEFDLYEYWAVDRSKM